MRLRCRQKMNCQGRAEFAQGDDIYRRTPTSLPGATTQRDYGPAKDASEASLVMSKKLINAYREPGTGFIVLNGPETRNALSLDLRAALAEQLEAMHAESDIRVIVLAGSGPAFCAGGDLKSLAGRARPACSSGNMTPSDCFGRCGWREARHYCDRAERRRRRAVACGRLRYRRCRPGCTFGLGKVELVPDPG